MEQIVVTCSNAILLPGETTQATAAVYPTDATNRSVTWSSSNPAVATVNQSGLVTAVAAGEAEIIATANDGSDAEGSYLLTVEKQLQINVSVVNDTVFTQGSDPCDLAYFNLTPASAARMAQAGYTPAWTMTRTAGSGDASLSEFSTSLSRNGNNYTTTAALLGGAVFPDAGTETYVITCSAGPYEESVEINVTVDGTVYAEAVKLTDASLGYNTLTTQIDEAVTLPYTPYSADSNPVPQNMDVSVFGNTLYNDHAFELYSEDGLEVSFDESCSYAARVIYRKGNLSYTVNAVFNVADENGVIRLFVDDIAIDKAFVSLAEGESAALTATVTPNDAYNKAVTWSSSDPSVATVSADGLVTAVAPGLAVISCTATDGSGVAGICTVSVEDFLQLDEDQMAFTVYTDGQDHANLGTINVTLESQKRLTQNGMNVKWTLERLSGDSTELGVSEYAAAAEDGLSVSGNLIKLLRVKSAGTDTYRLTCTSGNYSDSCLITVTAVQGNLPSAVTLATTNYTTRIGEWIEIDTSCTLTPNGSELPEDAEMFIDGGNAFRNALSMLYSYAEPEKLSFDTAGTFTANVVFSGSNYRYECPITIAVADEDDIVPANITDVIVSEEELLLVPGQSFTLSASVLPANASHSAIIWTSSDTSVATVNSSTGKVTAIGPGYASIVAGVPESDYQGSCLVYVEQGINFRDAYGLRRRRDPHGAGYRDAHGQHQRAALCGSRLDAAPRVRHQPDASREPDRIRQRAGHYPVRLRADALQRVQGRRYGVRAELQQRRRDQDHYDHGARRLPRPPASGEHLAGRDGIHGRRWRTDRAPARRNDLSRRHQPAERHPGQLRGRHPVSGGADRGRQLRQPEPQHLRLQQTGHLSGQADLRILQHEVRGPRYLPDP